MRELVEKTRFAYRRLADHRDDLAVPFGRLAERRAQLLELLLATDELAKPAYRARIKAAFRRARSGCLENLDPFGEPLDVSRTKRAHFDEILDETQRPGCQEHRSRARHLFHARRKMSRLADCGVVHLQV